MAITMARGVVAVGPRLEDTVGYTDGAISYEVGTDITYNPPTSTSESIPVGVQGKVTVVGGLTGAGHAAGGLFWTDLQTGTKSVPLIVGAEGKIELTSGSVVNAVGVESQLASFATAASVTTQFIGFNAHLVSLASGVTLPAFSGMSYNIEGMAGTITTFQGCRVSMATSNTGSIGTLYGYIYEDITTATALTVTTKIAFESRDPTAKVRRRAGGASSTYVELGGLVLSNTTQAATSTAASYEVLVDQSIPASLLNQNGMKLEIEAWGDTVSSTSAKDIGVQFGDSGSPTSYVSGSVTSTAAMGWRFNYSVMRLTATSQAIAFGGQVGSTVVSPSSVITNHTATAALVARVIADAANGDVTYRTQTVKLFPAAG